MNQTQLDSFLKCFLQIDDPVGHSKFPTAKHNHHEHDNDSDGLLIAKVTAMIVLCCASAICGLIPFFLDRCFHWTEKRTNARSATVVKCLLYFGGGVLLATTFLHLLPEVQELVESLQQCEVLPELGFPLAELLMCGGFFLMYFIEEAIHAYIHRNQTQDEGAAAAFERGHSIRHSHLMRETSSEAAMSPNQSYTIENNHLATPVAVSSTLSVKNMLKLDIKNEKHNETKHTCHEIYQNQCKTSDEHHHSHLPVEGDVLASSLRGLFIVLALSLHELFEGMAIGLERSSSSVWFMFGAVSAHKLVLAFCVGVELIVARTRPILSIVYVLTFAVVSPLGIGIGILVSQDESGPSVVSALLQGLACGTLLYVVFFEILSKNRSGLLAYLALFVGFLVMFGLQQLGVSGGNGHSHGKCNDGVQHEQEHDHNDDKIGDAHNYRRAQINYEQQLQALRQLTQKLIDKAPHSRR